MASDSMVAEGKHEGVADKEITRSVTNGLNVTFVEFYEENMKVPSPACTLVKI